jgi:hypothetical protein
MIKIDIKVNVDPKALLEDYVDAAYKAMEELMMAAFHEWQEEAGRKLKTTQRAYRDAIQHKLVSPGEVDIFLQQSDDFDNWIANALEGGHPTFNIREKVLAKAVLHPERMKNMKDKQRRRMFAYLKSVGRLGLPAVPYSDVGFGRKGSKEGKPSDFRRVSKNQDTKSKWQHPGFRPIGQGGLSAPLRDHVVEFIQKEAPEIFNKLFAKVSA